MKKSALFLVLAASSLAAAPIQWAGNGHWYEVSSVAANLSNARTAALASTWQGQSGYLVTITSAAENAFVFSLTSSMAWAGGSDAAVEGTWRWLDGPEAGQAFTYTNWEAGEPNNLGDEDGLQLNRFAGAQTWNDAPASGSLLYIIEYADAGTSNIPEPAAFGLTAIGALALGLLHRRQRHRDLTTGGQFRF